MTDAFCHVVCVALPQGGAGDGVAAERTLQEALETRLRSQLDAAALSRGARLKRVGDRLRSGLGHLLLRHALRRHGVADGAWRIAEGQYGKPYLPDHAGLEFNISHAGRWVACALSHAPVGIDVEQVRNVDLRIAERYFQPGEYVSIMACAPQQRLDYFFRLWTAKEAYVKALGAGLQRDLASFTIELGHRGTVCVTDTQAPPHGIVLSHLALDDGHKLALCRLAAGPAPTLEWLDLDVLCR